MTGIIKAAELIPQQDLEAMGQPCGPSLLLKIMHSIGTSSFTAGLKVGAAIESSDLLAEDQWLCRAYCCVHAFCLGNLEDAEGYIQSALQLSCVKEIEPARATALYLLCTVLILKNMKNPLLPHLAALTAIGNKYDFSYHLAGSKRLAAFERYLSFDTASALDLLDGAISFYQGFGNRAMLLSTRLTRCLWALDPTNKKQLDLEQARQDVEALGKLQAGLMLNEIAQSTFGAIAREAGHLALAESFLFSAMQSAQSKGAKQVICGITFHLSKLYFTSGDIKQGRLYLQRAMNLASVNHYVMFWDIHLPTLLQMLLLSLHYGYSGVFAVGVLDHYFGSSTALYLQEKIKGLGNKAIVVFADTFILEYRREPSKQYYLVRAFLFGKTEITVNGVKIADSEWKTRKNKGLLEYLLLSGGKRVSRETLINIFWPQADSESAQISLRTALYQLRKTLAAYKVNLSGSNAFLVETPDGLQINKTSALEVDLHHFLEYQRQYNARLKSAASAEATEQEILEKMVTLYRGELLESRDYGDLLLFEREKCKLVFEKACLDLSALYLQKAEPARAEEILLRAYRAEPYSEAVCLKLLQLLMAQGMRHKAIKLFNTFKKRLIEDFELEVDPRLAEAIGKLQNKGQSGGAVKKI